MSRPAFLGRIALLQIKRSRLIQQVGSSEVFDPDPLLATEQFRLTPLGAMGRAAGGWLLDRHHEAHPENPEPNPKRALSIGFSAHYRAMQERFGEVALGAAGENVIVASDGMITLDTISGGIEIRTEQRSVILEQPEVAEPCVPFTRFMMGRPDAPLEEVKPHREFLRQGMRGYVVGLTNLGPPVVIRPGDEVWGQPAR
jgi:hypothetical protein